MREGYTVGSLLADNHRPFVATFPSARQAMGFVSHYGGANPPFRVIWIIGPDGKRIEDWDALMDEAFDQWLRELVSDG